MIGKKRYPCIERNLWGGSVVVTIIFCGFLWWSSDQYYSGIYRTTTNTKLKQATCSGHAIHPRPEGRGFPRIFDKIIHPVSLFIFYLYEDYRGTQKGLKNRILLKYAKYWRS